MCLSTAHNDILAASPMWSKSAYSNISWIVDSIHFSFLVKKILFIKAGVGSKALLKNLPKLNLIFTSLLPLSYFCYWKASILWQKIIVYSFNFTVEKNALKRSPGLKTKYVWKISLCASTYQSALFFSSKRAILFDFLKRK